MKNRSCLAPVFATALVFLWMIVSARAAGAASVRIELGGSFKAIGEGGSGQHAERLVRSTLSDDEAGAPLEFAVALKMRRFGELQARLANREVIPSSEMGERYLPLANDYESVAAWLAAAGFAITQRDPCRLAIYAQGPVSLVAQVFQTRFARVANDLGEFTSAVSAPTVPDEIAPVLVGINGLQPHLQPRQHLQFAPSSTTSNAPPFLPSQILHAYNADALSTTGSGQKIGIVINTYPLDTDLLSFWSTCGVSQSLSNIEKVQVVSGTLSSPSGEETLDVEWASSIAPGAGVRVYATKDLSFVHIDQAYARILSDLSTNSGLRQVSLSFGLGEKYTAASQVTTDAQYFASLAGAGVTVLVASGDGGSSPGTTGQDHTGPTQAESPASDVNVTAVGGTSLYLDATTGAISSETAWYGSGGGVSLYSSRPSWQTGTGVPSGTMRCVPDVALVADSSTGGYLVLNGTAYIVGGTSWSAPCWAGFCAHINQYRSSNGLGSLGLLGPRIYPLLGTGSFWDITSGSNGSNGVYNAGAGYDLCTGIGVPDMVNLLDVLTPRAPSLSVQAQSQTIDVGQDATFTVSAGGSAPLAYQWQISTDGGSTWSNLTDGSPYSGTTTSTLVIFGAASSLNGAEYRCVVSNAQGSVTSSAVTLTVVAADYDVPAMPPWALLVLGLSLLVAACSQLKQQASI